MTALETLMVLTNAPDRETALSMARQLVEQRLAACVNVLSPCDSVYQWEGKMEETTEVPMLIKCHRSRYAALEAKICALHPYEVPEIIALPLAEGSEAYLSWIERSTCVGESR